MRMIKDKDPFITRFCYYLLLQVFAIIVRTYITHTSTIVWAINVVGLFLLFGKYLLRVPYNVFFISVIYVLCGVLTIVFNVTYLGDNLKGIGTNINLVVFPIYLVLLYYVMTNKTFDEDNARDVFRLLSMLGIVAIIFAWINGYRDIVRVFQGRLSPYRADTAICGFFYSKNIYGAFVSISIAADLYLYYYEYNKKSLLIMLFKALAVVFSFSRAALLQAGVMLFLFFWNSRKRAFREWLILVLIAVVGIILVLKIPQIQKFVLNSVIRPQVGDAGRFAQRRNALIAVSSNVLSFIFGVGYAGIASLHIDIDNTYLYLFFSGGIMKVLFYLWVMFMSYQGIKRLSRTNPIAANICRAVGLSYIVFAFFESVAIFELGILNYLYSLFILFVPYGMDLKIKTIGELK